MDRKIIENNLLPKAPQAFTGLPYAGQSAYSSLAKIIKVIILLGIGVTTYHILRWLLKDFSKTTANNLDATSAVTSKLSANLLLQNSTKLLAHTGLTRDMSAQHAVICPLPYFPAQEFQVNTYFENDQTYPSVANLADGGWVIVWTTWDRNGIAVTDLYAQRYSLQGFPVREEFKINIDTYGSHRYSDVIGLANDDWVVTWSGTGLSDFPANAFNQIYGQRYNANAVRIGLDFRVNTSLNGTNNDPAITNLNDGGWVIAWYNAVGAISSYGNEIYLQRYLASGTRANGQLRVNSQYETGGYDPAVVSLNGGNFIVVWTSYAPTAEYNIYARCYASNGIPLGAEFRVNTYTKGRQINGAVAALIDGGWLIAWASQNQVSSTSGYDVFAQRYAANGQAIDGEFPVNTYTKDEQDDPVITSLPDGGWLIIWSSWEQDGAGEGVYGQRYLANGVRAANEFRINTFTKNWQYLPDLITLPDGDVLAVWVSGGYSDADNPDQDGSKAGVFAQRLSVTFTLNAVNTRYSYLEDSTEPVLINNIYLKHVTYQPQSVRVTATLSPPNAGSLASDNVIKNTTMYFAATAGQWTAVTNSVSEMNEILACLYFLPALHFDQNITLNLVAWDGMSSNSTLTLELIGQAINHLPLLTHNNLSVTEGVPVILSNQELAATDINSPSERLVFLVMDLQHGSFIRVNASGETIDHFSQAAILAGEIEFRDDGSGNAPSYAVSVTDGELTTVPNLATVTFTRKSASLTDSLAFKIALPVGITLAVVLGGVALHYSRKRMQEYHKREKTTEILTGLLAGEGVNLKTETDISWYLTPHNQQPIRLKPGETYRIVDVSPADKQWVAQFYQQHPVQGYSIASVRAVYNPTFNQSFVGYLQTLNQRATNPSYSPQWQTENCVEWRRATLQKMQELAANHQDEDYPNVRLLPLWHGTSNQSLKGIFSTGFANLALSDAGFYGKGIYGAHEAEYAYRVYSRGALLLNWVAVFSAYPVIAGDMEKFRQPIGGRQMAASRNYQNYDAHFIPVTPDNPDNPDEINYYPCKVNQESQYTEVVVFESAACLPRYIVEIQKDLLMSLRVLLPFADEGKKKDTKQTLAAPARTQTSLVYTS